MENLFHYWNYILNILRQICRSSSVVSLVSRQQFPPQIWTQRCHRRQGKRTASLVPKRIHHVLFLVSQQQCVAPQSPPQIWIQRCHHRQGKRTAFPVPMRIYLLSFLYLSSNMSPLNLRLKTEHNTTIIDRERGQRLLFQCVFTCCLSCISATMCRPSISASNLNTALPLSTGIEDSVSCSNAYLPDLFLVSRQQYVAPQSPPQIWTQNCDMETGQRLLFQCVFTCSLSCTSAAMCRPSISASKLNTTLPSSTGKKDSVSCFNAYLPALFLVSQQLCVVPQSPPQNWTQHYHHRQGKRTASPVPMRIYLLSFLYLSNNASSLNNASNWTLPSSTGKENSVSCSIIEYIFTCSLSSISAAMCRPSISASNLNTALPS